MLDVEALVQATATLRSLIAAGPRAWDGAPEEVVVAALGAAADLSRSCDAVKIAAAGAVARRSDPLTPIESLARRLGHSNSRRLVMDVFGVNGYVAGSWIEVAAAIQPRTGISTGDLPPARPAVAAALQAGELSAEIAKAIVEQLSKLTGETVQGGTDVAEAALVANATGGRINLFAPARVSGAAGSAGTAGHFGSAASQEPHAPQNRAGQDPATENGDPRDRAGQAWFGQQDHPAPAPGTSPGSDSGTDSDRGSGTLLGMWAETGAGSEAGSGLGAGSLFGAGPSFGPGHGQGFDTGFGSRGGSPFGAGTGTGAGQGADSPFSGGAVAGGAWPSQQTPGSSQGQHSSQGSRPPAPYRPVLPPSMDDTARRRGIGSAIAGGRVGLDRVKEESRAWGTVLDPDGAEPRYEQQRRNRSFRLTKKASGGFEISGFAPDVEGNQIRTLLDAYLSPRTQDIGPDNLFNQSHGQTNTSDGQPDGAGADATRTHAQRSFDALAHILALHAASPEAPTTAGAAPTLLISTTLTAIDHHLHDCATHDAHKPDPEAMPGLDGVGAGWWPSGLDQIPLNALGIPDPDAMIDLRFARVGGDGTPVPLTAVMHLLCDAALQIMLTDPTGVPLKLGRAQRLFTKDQRRVLIARDHHCRAPGCDIPAQWCEVHHVTPWQNGGKTNITNAILLCNFHHHEIDRGRLKVTHHPDTNARFEHKYTVETTWTPHQHHHKNTG